MPLECAMAFKEWAAVCLALRAGRQSILLRKGGIHEGRDGFRVAHSAFWLFPTFEHERADGLIPDAAAFLRQADSSRPAPGTLTLRDFAVVDGVAELKDEAELVALRGRHVFSDETVRQRFHYRQPGLFVLSVRIFSRPEAWEISDEPRFGGCRSWVELPCPLATEGLLPAVRDEAVR